ncbi:MAG: magnesium chelatase, partial [Ignisphaera sp.]
MDRFLIKLSTGYVSHKGFVKMSKSIREIEKAIEGLKPVIGGQQLVDGMERVENVKVDDSVLDYIASIVEESRVH